MGQVVCFGADELACGLADCMPPKLGQPGLLPDMTHQVGDVHAQHILNGLDHAVLQLGKGGEIIGPQNLAVAVDVWEVTCSSEGEQGALLQQAGVDKRRPQSKG